jgi:hypothetical protein
MRTKNPALIRSQERRDRELKKINTILIFPIEKKISEHRNRSNGSQPRTKKKKHNIQENKKGGRKEKTKAGEKRKYTERD